MRSLFIITISTLLFGVGLAAAQTHHSYIVSFSDGFGASMSSPTAIAPVTALSSVLVNVTFSPTSTRDLVLNTAVPGWTTQPECGVSYDFGTKKASVEQQAFLGDTSICSYLLDRGERNFSSELYRQANDTLRLFIENCASIDGSWLEFTPLTASVMYMDTNNERFIDYREWLKKVLYYNTTDSDYYCADVQSIYSTFHYFEGRGYDLLGGLAVGKYIKETGRCKNWPFMLDYDTAYKMSINIVTEMWRDTVKDSVKTPLDTTLPSIDGLGLGILRGPSEVKSGEVTSKRFINFSAERNPFTDNVALKAELSAPTMLRLDVFDELGHQIYGEGLGYKQAGEFTYRVNSKGWASGMYYARLATSGGEVKTIKLIKE
jgi:hypothetical protein